MQQVKRSWKNTLYVWLAASIIAVLSALLADSIKIFTEQTEHILYTKASSYRAFIWVFPFLGLLMIFCLRKIFFHNKVNKGLKEVLDGLHQQKKNLPLYKIPSHYINGFLTVVFGGSTGVEVSTVVSTAAIGRGVAQRFSPLFKYKNELICAGIAAGITALFNSPLGGLFFVLEVFMKKKKNPALLILLNNIVIAYFINHFISPENIFHFQILTWKLSSVPFFILLGFVAGLHSVYLTRSVIFIKKLFSKYHHELLKVITGAALISLGIYLFPALYGDGYLAINHLISPASPIRVSDLLVLCLVLLLKPVITSVTLSAGGDGGVFAPSLFMGAFLGAITAFILNFFFHAGVIPANFILIGMAAVLSASIHAPITAICLLCSISGNYVLIIPLAIGAFVARATAKKIFPFTVYTYPGK